MKLNEIKLRKSTLSFLCQLKIQQQYLNPQMRQKKTQPMIFLFFFFHGKYKHWIEFPLSQVNLHLKLQYKNILIWRVWLIKSVPREKMLYQSGEEKKNIFPQESTLVSLMRPRLDKWSFIAATHKAAPN